MKPSDFILNSDYLSIAQVDSKEYTLTIGGGSLVVNAYTEQNLDFTTTAQTGSIDRILISKDGGDYMLGSYMSLFPTWASDYSNNVGGFIHVFRVSKTKLRAQVMLQNYGSGTSTYPSMSFRIKVSSFKPPNVF